MRRIILSTLASSVLTFALPAAASAHSHHHRAHHRHRAHTVVFTHGRATSTPGTTAPTTPVTPGSEPAGTITSFENGVLKITLADNSVVTGKVTEGTRIECAASSTGTGGDDQDDDSGDEHSGDFHSSDHPGSFHGDDEHGSMSVEPTPGSCGVSSLAVGAKVKEAELLISSGGAVWEKIELA
jgi:hypothetical protein